MEKGNFSTFFYRRNKIVTIASKFVEAKMEKKKKKRKKTRKRRRREARIRKRVIAINFSVLVLKLLTNDFL